MRFLAIDLGLARTGLAVGDDVTHIVTPVDVINVPRRTSNAALLAALAKAIERHGPDALVIGLPINMDGTEGGAAESVRAFGAALAQHTHLPVHYQDERLTSFAAEQQLAGTGRTRKEKQGLIDALAAAQFLRDFLAGRAGPARHGDPPSHDEEEHRDECG